MASKRGSNKRNRSRLRKLEAKMVLDILTGKRVRTETTVVTSVFKTFDNAGYIAMMEHPQLRFSKLFRHHPPQIGQKLHV